MKLLITALLLAVTNIAMSQETHYHRALRSQDTDYGLTQEPHFNGSGMYWSRTRNVDDVTISNKTPEEKETARKEFIRLCNLAYDAFEHHDAHHTVIYGDSALQTSYHTLDLYFFMGISFETLGNYSKAEQNLRLALGSGFPDAQNIYRDFQERQKQRKIAEKQKKKEEKQRKKEEKLRGK